MTDIYVGSGKPYTTLSAAIAASSANDTIYLAQGTYHNDPVEIGHSLSIVGLGTGARLVWSGGNIDNRKGIIVANGAVEQLTIDNVDFVGARVADRNGAGIRFEGTNLTVTDSNFTNNQNGILATAKPNTTVTIDNSTFTNNGAGDGYSHAVYAANIAEVLVSNSTFVGTKVGHHIKSIADHTTVINSILNDAKAGTSLSIDVGRGGDLLVSGNTFTQSIVGNADFINYSTIRGGIPGNIIIADNVFNNNDNIGRIINNSTTALSV